MNQSPQILIIDDNPQNLQVLGKILKEHGYFPRFAVSGAQALTISLKKTIPDLILLDISMPEMNGFEVCQKLKEEASTKEIPVIFLTAHTEKEKVIKGFQLGAVDYVTKPFNIDELLTRIQTHLKLKQTLEDLKQSNATKEKFFSIIAHDLNNLFGVLIGFTNLLIMARAQQLEEKIDYSLPALQRNLKQGYNLLTNLLEWSKMQSNRIEPQMALLDLTSLVEQNIELLSARTAQKNIHISSSLEQTSVFADENMLSTVIRNLLSNAVKFTPDNGQIQILAQRKENVLEFSISDTGVGIESKNIDKLFRIDVSHSTRGTGNEMGNGLGLVLCKELVDNMGGSITVESEKGKGSRFLVCLPFPSDKI